jgi:hypothetical protein
VQAGWSEDGYLAWLEQMLIETVLAP